MTVSHISPSSRPSVALPALAGGDVEVDLRVENSEVVGGDEDQRHVARETGAISDGESERLGDQCWQALKSVAHAQADHQTTEEPASRFIALLVAALTSGKAHIVDAETGQAPQDPGSWGWTRHDQTWKPQGDRIGWLDDGQIYLEPDAAFAAVQTLARHQGASLPVGQRTLWKRMAEKQLLATVEQGHLAVRRTIGGKRRRMIHLHADALSPLFGPIGPIGPDPRVSAPLGTDFADQKSPDREKTVHENGPQALDSQDGGPIGPIGPEIEHKGQTGDEIFSGDEAEEFRP